MSGQNSPTLPPVLGDLGLSPGTPPSALEAVQRAVAVAQITGQQGGFAVRTPVGAPAEVDPQTQQALATLINQLAASPPPPQRVVRRDFAVPISPDPRVGAAPGAGQAPSSTLGPFQDTLGRPILIDVFDIPARIGIQRTGGAQPFLFVELPAPTGNSATIALGTGSVWIAASSLAAGAPAGGFVGLRIKSGTVAFGTTVALSARPIVIPANANLTLTLVLDPAAAASGSGAGADARAASVTVPAQVTLSFAAAAATLTAAGDGKLTAFGTTMAFTPQVQPAHFDPFFGRVDFPFTAAPADFAVGVRHSTLATFAGHAALFGAAWSLPISLGDPASLGAAAGAGGLAIGLLPGLSVRWTGASADAACGPCVLLVEPGLLAVSGFTASAPGETQSLLPGKASSLRLTAPNAFAFRFTSVAAGTETWAFLTQLVAAFDEPRTVNDERVRLSGPALIVFVQTSAGTQLSIEAARAQPPQAAIQSYCLKNLLLKASDPLALFAFLSLSGANAGRAAAQLQFNLRFTLPILPDPYATNLLFDPLRAIDTGVIGPMSVLLRWQDDEPPTLDLLLPSGALNGVNAAPPSSGAVATPVGAVDRDAADLARLGAQFDSAVGGGISGPALLDLSTNVAQFGVRFGTAAAFAAAVVAKAAPTVAGLFLKMPGTDVRLIALPAVQWEPVLTPDQTTPFPSPLTFANSGQTVELAANSVTLVPVAPRPAIDALLTAYNAERVDVGARFTLPFGIAAFAHLQHSSLILFPSPGLSEVQPVFGAANLRGGDQISLRASSPLIIGPGSAGSPSLPGTALQLHNARASGVPTATTVLTPIDDTFNSNFGAAASDPRVPVTRIDISGFGESLFSDWRNPVDAAATISKARFDVLVGRTSREIVQAFSVLYPYAVRVVRTITIERQNGAAMVRHDSGWQAVSDGVYHYPHPNIVTHPGVVRAAVAVTNIRDTGQRHTTPDGSELMAVRFDCALTMEGVILGAGPEGVPALDQLGYVQLTDAHALGQLAPDQYAELLNAAGPLGGVIDCTIDIGGTGQRMRIVHVGVAASPGAGGPEFVMAAWGSPVLPGGGQWSFLRQDAGAPAPGPVSSDQGVPLVRAGPATAAPPPTSPYRFTDPQDLLHPDSPAADYGLLHATGTQRTLFSRPKLEATGPHAITSTRVPVIADPYALATATGPFPRIDACIPFPNAAYSLAIGGGGNLALQPTPFDFTTPVLRRVLRESATARSIAYTADEDNTPSKVSLLIDTAAATPWSVDISNLSLANESGSLGEVTRVVGDVQSSASAPTQLGNARFVFGPALKPVAALVSFLEQFGLIPPPAVSMTNDWQLLAGITFDFTKLLPQLGPAVKAFIEEFIVDLDVKMQSLTKATSSSFVMQFEVTVKIPTPFKPIVGIGLAKVQFQMGDFGNAWTFVLGVGIGVSFKLPGDFDVTAYYAETQFLITGDTVFGLGASSLVKGNVDLKVVAVSVSIEAKIALLKVTCGVSDSTIWGAAQVTIALEVSIFFVIDIEFDVQTEWTHNLDGGPCDLPDVL